LPQFGKFRHNYADLGPIRQIFDSLQTRSNTFRLDRFRHNWADLKYESNKLSGATFVKIHSILLFSIGLQEEL